MEDQHVGSDGLASTDEGDVPSQSAVASDSPAAEIVPPLTKPRRRRRWLWRAVMALLIVIVLVAAGTVAAGWYFSDQLLAVDHSTEYSVTVSAIDSREITLTRTSETERAGVLALAWPSGRALVDASVRLNSDSVVRTITEIVEGALHPGLKVRVDVHVFDGDPKTALGLDFTEVSIPSELGDLPAWQVPATALDAGTTWVIAVHGRRANRQENLRVLPTIAAAGLPALVIAYRNDVEAPASPDGFYHLGDTEWRDVQAAVAYARGHGATGVVLYGWSMGGAAALHAVRRMSPADAGLVRAIVLDSPPVDWSTVIDLQAEQRHLPGFLTWTAKRLIERRAHLSLSGIDQRKYADTLRVPVLVFVDKTDTRVPPEPTLQFAQARSDLITLVVTEGGGHTASWNVDAGRYESTLRVFLERFNPDSS